jgi:hypothetical protein
MIKILWKLLKVIEYSIGMAGWYGMKKTCKGAVNRIFQTQFLVYSGRKYNHYAVSPQRTFPGL